MHKFMQPFSHLLSIRYNRDLDVDNETNNIKFTSTISAYKLQGIIQLLEQATNTIYMKSLSHQSHYNVNNTKVYLTFIRNLVHIPHAEVITYVGTFFMAILWYVG